MPGRRKENRGSVMPAYKQSVPRFAQPSIADVTCLHCERVTRHEHWCLTQNADVRYAFQAAIYPHLLTLQDSLILHALGVTWLGTES
jgi:hypothetical protein